MPQLLAQPTLNASCRDDDKLLVKGISDRLSQHICEPNDKGVGTLGSMYVEGHTDEPRRSLGHV
jgi:hypothetical protein